MLKNHRTIFYNILSTTYTLYCTLFGTQETYFRNTYLHHSGHLRNHDYLSFNFQNNKNWRSRISCTTISNTRTSFSGCALNSAKPQTMTSDTLVSIAENCENCLQMLHITLRGYLSHIADTIAFRRSMNQNRSSFL